MINLPAARNTPSCTIATSLIESGHNDCEAVVRRLYPEVGEALDWLGQFATARMTGTGCCVFAVFTDENEARQVTQQDGF
jgi:4-diphosphocytidyl-2-C-methyl-D-erythritol kinase